MAGALDTARRRSPALEGRGHDKDGGSFPEERGNGSDTVETDEEDAKQIGHDVQ